MNADPQILSKPVVREPVTASDRLQTFVLWTSRLFLGSALILMPWFTLSPATSPPSDLAFSMHVGALAGLTVLALLSFDGVWRRMSAVLFVFAYSALMELLQYFLPERNGTLGDVAANALGCLVGLSLYLVAVGIRRKMTAGARNK